MISIAILKKILPVPKLRKTAIEIYQDPLAATLLLVLPKSSDCPLNFDALGSFEDIHAVVSRYQFGPELGIGTQAIAMGRTNCLEAVSATPPRRC
jgi:hypothetical protein